MYNKKVIKSVGRNFQLPILLLFSGINSFLQIYGARRSAKSVTLVSKIDEVHSFLWDFVTYSYNLNSGKKVKVATLIDIEQCPFYI